jgi:hypothetical protein
VRQRNFIQLRFENWLEEVNAWTNRICGANLSDLPDADLRSMFDDEYSSEKAAIHVLDGAGWPGW